jgi:hypothetical protein
MHAGDFQCKLLLLLNNLAEGHPPCIATNKFVAGRDQTAADQPNDLAEGLLLL